MLKIFNECLNAINKCIKGLLEDGLLSVNQDFGQTIEPWQRKALNGIVGDHEVTDITGCHLPQIDIHGMPTDAMVVGFQYKKDNRLCWASALVVSNAATQWSNVSVLTAEEAQAGLDEDKQVVGLKYPSIGQVGQMAAEALPAQAA
ncbi:hypothetical protein pEaSNUABM37_00055 [Erwinia phage pEa_SNUABM_37]|nr:hypothetical protein pEaSNUABM37_00055 [Erwinia phage pEa_SNUABM_37]QXO10525.1 hypothetical protein pEaSNUABM48_00055 [Erwinia phage pEa_SNUABM_48]